jgi:CDP-diacylglycerol--glycerol-3-phosphate 3-phosphatidyltransferase
MNLPNTLTLARIFLVPLLVAVLVQQNFSIGWSAQHAIANEFLALIIFLAAAATDLLDGYLARRWSQVTTVGTLLDPIADKLLISSALIALVEIHRIPAWMVILIVGREFAVSGLRSIAATEGYTIEASELGKTKMALQVLAIALVMVAIHYPAWAQAAMICLWGVLIFAMLSAFDYFRKFWRRVDDKVKLRRRRELLREERLRQRRDRAARTALNPKAG